MRYQLVASPAFQQRWFAKGLTRAAARKAHVGDLLIICTYSPVDDDAVPQWKPRVVLLGEGNRVNEIKKT